MGLQSWIRDNLISPGHTVGATEQRLDLAGQKAVEGYSAAIKGYSDVPETYKSLMAGEDYKPYMDLGKTSVSALEQLFGNPEGYLHDPSVNARLRTSLGAVETSAAARGRLFGGATLIELMKKGGEFASEELDKAAARYTGGAQLGLNATGASYNTRLAATAGYDASKANLAEMEIGRGNAGSRQQENQAQWKASQANYQSGIFSSWFGGSGPFGSATGASMCYIAAYHFGHATPEHYLVAMHVRNGKTWKAYLARVVYGFLKPLFRGLLKEATRG